MVGLVIVTSAGVLAGSGVSENMTKCEMNGSLWHGAFNGLLPTLYPTHSHSGWAVERVNTQVCGSF